MKSFEGKLAVVTGGGTGMGRELVIQLAAEGCDVAACDVNLDTLAETRERALEGAPAGTKVTTHRCDVSDETQMLAFRDEVLRDHETDHVDLLFNNAGVAGGGSFLTADRAEWDRVFGICWGGVYNGCRAFVPLVVKSEEGYVVNTSSVNGFWATLGLGVPHTAYSAAKFAVKGFTEALREDFKVNAPHVKAAVVMPGHIGTEIVANTMRTHGLMGDDNPELLEAVSRHFIDNAPLSAAQAVTIILDGVREGKWRILVGEDAHMLDRLVREDPEGIYDKEVALRSMIGQ